jgi:hypothetical protein
MILMKTGMHYEPASIYLVCVLYGPSRPVCPTQVGHWAACEASRNRTFSVAGRRRLCPHPGHSAALAACPEADKGSNSLHSRRATP